ncbi:MAG TPA: ABC transporter permease [Syntrophomonadaceae bacterium]|nr:ABC transporter permease [Syntrophomonadaceae bacterium]
MLLLRQAYYIFQEVGRSLIRNSLLNFAAVGTTAISLFVLGVGVLLVINTNEIAKTIESDIEIMVYMRHNLAEEDALTLEPLIDNISGVQETTFISRDEALKSLVKQFGDEVEESVGEENPLPDTIKVKISDPREVNKIAAEIEDLPGVESVRYGGQDFVKKLFSLTNWVRIIGLLLITLLGFCGIFLIATTTRLTIFARRREINIMKYVGATDWFVRWPFLLEGIILGFFGALLAVGVLYFSYGALIAKIQETISFLPLVNSSAVLFRIFEGLLAIGIVMGAVGSTFSVRRYLRV